MPNQHLQRWGGCKWPAEPQSGHPKRLGPRVLRLDPPSDPISRAVPSPNAWVDSPGPSDHPDSPLGCILPYMEVWSPQMDSRQALGLLPLPPHSPTPFQTIAPRSWACRRLMNQGRAGLPLAGPGPNHPVPPVPALPGTQLHKAAGVEAGAFSSPEPFL